MGDESGESTPPRPRRRIKNILVMSSSGSESDDSGPATSTRKKRLRVVSDSDEGSSGSSLAVGSRRKRVLPKLRDSDFSDSSGWETDRSTVAPCATAASQGKKLTSGFASDSSEGNSDKCSICLMRFTDQQVGTPQTCEHIFCLDCITEWSRNVNTCPVDRMSFDSIVVRESAGGRVLSTQPVQVVERPPSVDLFLVQETCCEICGSSGREDTMLLCDGCDLGFHMECLTPPLTEIPINQWVCSRCSNRLDRMHVIPAFEELFSEEGEEVGRRMVSRARRLRQWQVGGERSRGDAADGPSTSRARAPAPAPRARTHTRTRNRRRTTTVIVEYDLEENGKQPITKRLRKKVKRRKTKKRVPRTAARRAHVRESVRVRLAAQSAAGGAACALGARRALGAMPTLHLFGSAHELDYFSDEEAAPERAAGGLALAARTRPNAAAVAAYRQARRKMVSIGAVSAVGGGGAEADLLSSIMESQERLHSPRAVLSVGAEGAVRVEVRGGGGATGRQAPSYGHGRGGGGWGGGYRYPEERAPPPHHAHDNGYGRGGTGTAHTHHPPHHARPHDDGFHSYERWRHHDAPYERDRRVWPRAAPPPRPRHPHPLPYGGDKPVPPLPEPPAFPLPEEEDERSDSSLVIDTDKYDPTEPTDDDDPGPAPLVPPASLAAVESILGCAGPAVSPALLDSAVRQALLEHRSPSAHDSDEPDPDGDCPNFSIYSATSVHIASGVLQQPTAPPPAPSPPAPSPPHEEELSPEAPPTPPPPPPPPPAPFEEDARRHSDEYKERVSKRCPITTNTRNPIKIKLNSPALLRRGGAPALLDDEEPEPEELLEEAAVPDRAPNLTPDRVPDRVPDTPSGDDDEHALEQEAERPEEPSCASRDPSSARDTDGSGGRSGDERAPSVPVAEDEAQGHKMTESISETEDERSYTPCLDEQREGGAEVSHLLDTELISDDDGDGLFSEEERREPAADVRTPAHTPAREDTHPPTPTTTPTPSPTDTGKKKKKKEKETKRDGKERKGKKRTEVAFKKSGKAKGRKYRAREGSSPLSGGPERAAGRRARERRRDLARYDVRSVLEGRRRSAPTKDAFGRDVSPPAPRTHSPSPSPSPASSPPHPPRRTRLSPSPRRVRALSPRRIRASPSPRRVRASLSPRRMRGSPSPRKVGSSPSPRRVRPSPSPRRVRPSPSPRRVRPSPSPRRVRPSPSPRRVRGRSSPSPSPAGSVRAGRRRRRSPRRRSPSRRKRRRSDSAPPPKPKEKKKKKRGRSGSGSRHKSPKRKRVRRRSPSPGARAAAPWSPRPPSPRTPPPLPPPPVPIEARRLRKRRDRSKHRRPDTIGPSKEVFTSGDNILVSVSFKESEGGSAGAAAARRERRERRRARRERAQLEPPPPKPVAIIDLERSPFRELTPSPERVIVLSDEERPPAAGEEPPASENVPAAGAGPKTPPEPSAAAAGTPPRPPDSPDAYDPYEPTASPPAPSPHAAPHDAPDPPTEPARLPMTLEAAQKTNMSADEVIDRRPLEPIEKVMALLQSTRDAPPDPPPEVPQSAPPAPAPGPPAPRVVLPEPANKPKLFLGKPSPIKSDPIKPMQQATKISRLPLPAVRGESPYSPGSSDFGDLFEPPAAHNDHRDVFDELFDKGPTHAPRTRRKNNRKKKGKSQQVEVRLDDDHLKVLDELPSSAVEMQVKSKFLKKLNRQERVVEEVKLVLKPHYNKKHVTKDEYKHILRRTVPKICHNKTGEINPSKIQALVEAYVKKFRKKHKLGLS